MKNKRFTVILPFIMLFLLSCGGGFEEESTDAADIGNSILGIDPSEENED